MAFQGSQQNIIGQSKPMLAVLDLVQAIAPTRASVVIVGESGTGKELIARALHHRSNRRDKPFVAINCAAIPDKLWESEMFGHERGAFTGAMAQKKGRFEMAHRGTLLLDEISEMPISLQAKFLRAIQEVEFERVGGTGTIKVDVRFIAASNRDLEQGVEDGWFREDLFYRLNVIKIHIPPLRDHKEDIPALTRYFVGKYANTDEKEVKGISNRALDMLMAYSFPGNIRELENIIRHGVVMAKEKQINVEDLPERLLKKTRTKQLNRHNFKSIALSQALLCITVSENGCSPKPWHQILKSVSIDDISEFLLNTNHKSFSRPEFANFLMKRAKSGKDKYATAGRYLTILKKNNICCHNGKKANQSRFRLSQDFVVHDKLNSVQA